MVSKFKDAEYIIEHLYIYSAIEDIISPDTKIYFYYIDGKYKVITYDEAKFHIEVEKSFIDAEATIYVDTDRKPSKYTRDAHLVFRDSREDKVYIIPIYINDNMDTNSIKIVETIYNYEYIMEILKNSCNLVAYMNNKYNMAKDEAYDYSDIYLLDKEGGYKVITYDEINYLAEKESSGPKYVLVVNNKVEEVLYNDEDILNLAEKIKEAYHKPVQIYKGFSKELEDYFEEDFEDLLGREVVKFIKEV